MGKNSNEIVAGGLQTEKRRLKKKMQDEIDQVNQNYEKLRKLKTRPAAEIKKERSLEIKKIKEKYRKMTGAVDGAWY